LIDDRIISAMVGHRVAGSVLLAIDRRDRGPGATRIPEENRRIVEIGKDTPVSNATDTGVFCCSMQFLVELDRLVVTGPRRRRVLNFGLDRQPNEAHRRIGDGWPATGGRWLFVVPHVATSSPGTSG
jgi:hypothetical protein